MMATLKDVSQSIRNGDWAATIDLKDAYFHMPIARVTEGSSVLLHDDHPASCGYVQGKGDSIDGLFG